MIKSIKVILRITGFATSVVSFDLIYVTSNHPDHVPRSDKHYRETDQGHSSTSEDFLTTQVAHHEHKYASDEIDVVNIWWQNVVLFFVILLPFLDFVGDASRDQVVNSHTNRDENNLAEILNLEDFVEAYGLTSRQIIVNFLLKPSLQIFECSFARLFHQKLLRFLVVSGHLRILLVDFLFHNVEKFSLEHDPLDFGEPVLGRQVDALLVDDDVRIERVQGAELLLDDGHDDQTSPHENGDAPLMLELALLKQVLLLYDFRMLFDGGRRSVVGVTEAHIRHQIMQAVFASVILGEVFAEYLGHSKKCEPTAYGDDKVLSPDPFGDVDELDVLDRVREGENQLEWQDVVIREPPPFVKTEKERLSFNVIFQNIALFEQYQQASDQFDPTNKRCDIENDCVTSLTILEDRS